ncbi:MAG: hypothetical protein ACM3X6_06055 [Patescibacteria group bacterium]
MRYLRPASTLRDPSRRVTGFAAAKLNRNPTSLRPTDLGRLGGEMARRMVEAALAYLTERAVAETRASFAKAAFGDRERDVTRPGQKA